MEEEQRGYIIQFCILVNQKFWEELMNKAKSLEISKNLVYEAYKKVKKVGILPSAG